MSEGYYESERILSEYLLFHYGDSETIFPWRFGPKEAVGFPFRIVNDFRAFFPKGTTKGGSTAALDLGCAVGRSSFELARHFDQVLGLDYSDAFIECAKKIQQTGHLDFQYLVQGDHTETAKAKVDPEIDRSRVVFTQGDAMNLEHLPEEGYDLILASNLICRLPDPGSFLESLSRLTKPSGILVLSTPLTWLESFTDRARWLGGTGDKDAVSSIRERLDGAFDPVCSQDLPMLIREHARKFQWTVCFVSVWKKRELAILSA